MRKGDNKDDNIPFAKQELSELNPNKIECQVANTRAQPFTIGIQKAHAWSIPSTAMEDERAQSSRTQEELIGSGQ